jgi:hypothetical protein
MVVAGLRWRCMLVMVHHSHLATWRGKDVCDVAVHLLGQAAMRLPQALLRQHALSFQKLITPATVQLYPADRNMFNARV